MLCKYINHIVISNKEHLLLTSLFRRVGVETKKRGYRDNSVEGSGKPFSEAYDTPRYTIEYSMNARTCFQNKIIRQNFPRKHGTSDILYKDGTKIKKFLK